MPHIYSKEQGKLLSMPVMEKPKAESYRTVFDYDQEDFDGASYQDHWALYKEWLSNQPSVFPEHREYFKEGKVYELNEDFLIDYTTADFPGGVAIPIKKEDEKERGIISQANSHDETLLASHSCTVCK
jgi:hypothetical protein